LPFLNKFNNILIDKLMYKRSKKNAQSLQKVVKVISTRTGEVTIGPQSQRLIPSITQALCGAEHISAGFLVMPPGKVAKPHIHRDNELIIFFLEGWGVALIGPDFEPFFHGPGDFLYIPEGVMHFGVNLSTEHRVVAIEMRTDPHFNEDVILFPKLEKKAEKAAAKLRKQFADGTLKVPSTWIGQGVGPYNHKE
jgi:uncharacterized RmlC-like cupin family protein